MEYGQSEYLLPVHKDHAPHQTYEETSSPETLGGNLETNTLQISQFWFQTKKKQNQNPSYQHQRCHA